MDLTFGPVPSRRLGRSLGINNIPAKHCSYSCLYCQVGTTHGQEIAPRPFHAPAEIRRQVAHRLAAIGRQGERVDYLTFVPDGEPTLDANLGAAIDGLRDLGPRIAVISNASLIWRPEVRAALACADWVSLKVDSVGEAAWRAINRPHRDLRLAAILDGIRSFVQAFSGTLVSETMLVAGVNDGEADMDALGRYLAAAGIRRAYLAIPHRPPAVAGVRGPDEAGLTRAYHTLSRHGPEVELLTGYEGDAFTLAGALANELLAITAVHPLRQSALDALLAKAGADMAVVDRLLENGRLKRVRHGGETYYARRLPGADGV
ncbi:MAG: radical SAM protein [Hydrogenophilaceae bacterium]